MLARRDRGFKMLDVEEGRCGNLKQVHILGCGQLLEGVRAAKEELAVNGRAAKARVELVKMAAAGCQLIREEIGKRHNLG